MAREAIFISYRRDDSAKEAADLYRWLAARVGQSHLYKDVDNIPIGADFGAHIRDILPRCQIALIVIGPSWADARDQDGRRRLEDPFDWVRVEVELALAAAAAGNLRVVPVLVSGARMPRANEAPSSLHPLLSRNAAIVRPHPDFDADAERLLNALALVAAPELVRIPAGEFMMGSPQDEAGRNDDEGPQHRVRIETFELGKFPITFAEWDAACAAGASLSQLEDKPNYIEHGWGRDRRPVINVSWHDTQAYIAWLNNKTSGGYRLPSEAEWEYACRAGTTAPYSTGAGIAKNQGQFNSQSTTVVGSYPPNDFGLHDMHGNVSEWCEDVWHGNYDGAPIDGSAWIADGDPSFRVLRGGDWHASPAYLRSASRYWRYRADTGYGHFGFRVAKAV